MDESEEKKNRRLAIYAVLNEVLKTLDILIHPFCPYTSEHLYQTVFEGKKKYSARQMASVPRITSK